VLSPDIFHDELLMKYRGTAHFIQDNKSKRARYGVKYYKLCNSKNWYIQNFYGRNKVSDKSATKKLSLTLQEKETSCITVTVFIWTTGTFHLTFFINFTAQKQMSAEQ
jgi:hypothetical protein